MFVDTTGEVVADSTVSCGVADRAYAVKLAHALAQMHFEPARYNGEAVRSYAYVNYQF